MFLCLYLLITLTVLVYFGIFLLTWFRTYHSTNMSLCCNHFLNLCLSPNLLQSSVFLSFYFLQKNSSICHSVIFISHANEFVLIHSFPAWYNSHYNSFLKQIPFAKIPIILQTLIYINIIFFSTLDEKFYCFLLIMISIK